MENTTEPHGLTVTHYPLDGNGTRVVGSIDGTDVDLSKLREIVESLDQNLELTEPALANPELNALAQAVRAALLAIDAVAHHLVRTHRGIHDGALNYVDDPRSFYRD